MAITFSNTTFSRNLETVPHMAKNPDHSRIGYSVHWAPIAPAKPEHATIVLNYDMTNALASAVQQSK